MTKPRIEGARVLVVGLGVSGLSSVGLLREKGAEVFATDMKPLEEMPEAAAKLRAWGTPFTQQSQAAFESMDLIVVSPGVPAGLEELKNARKQGVTVIGDVELASWYLQGSIVGITGSNGKTTTTALTGHILREAGIPVQVGGNIGNPVADMVATSRPQTWNVLELSSFQLHAIDSFHADTAVALNITPDHLDWHGTMEAYTAAKQRLFENQRPEDTAILNADDPACAAFSVLKASPLWFSSTSKVSPGIWIDKSNILFDGEPLMEVREVPLKGSHNLENVMAAAAAARTAGVPLDSIATGIRGFPGLEHRLEFVRSVSGVEFYNDSKATNVGAALKAIDAFSGGLWVILGGKDKGSDYRALRGPLAAKARCALLIGAAAPKIAWQLGNCVPKIASRTLENAIEEAWRRAAPGDTVLLAPACASFDQFKSYEHRGRTFKAAVARLEKINCA